MSHDEGHLKVTSFTYRNHIIRNEWKRRKRPSPKTLKPPGLRFEGWVSRLSYDVGQLSMFIGVHASMRRLVRWR
mgnify:CR=1 FL=1